MKKGAIAALVAALSCFAGTGQAAVPEVPFGPDFQVAGISVTSGGADIVYAGVREVNKKDRCLWCRVV
jgi:hypothetical protein